MGGRKAPLTRTGSAELDHLERNKATVVIVRKLLVVVWHMLTKRDADRHANPDQVASGLIYVAYGDVGARNLPAQVAAEANAN